MEVVQPCWAAGSTAWLSSWRGFLLTSVSSSHCQHSQEFICLFNDLLTGTGNQLSGPTEALLSSGWTCWGPSACLHPLTISDHPFCSYQHLSYAGGSKLDTATACDRGTAAWRERELLPMIIGFASGNTARDDLQGVCYQGTLTER